MPNDRFDLSGKIALVTGGGRGIGRGIALALAEHGADVAIVDLSGEQNAVAAQVRALGRRAWTFGQDLGKTAELHALADRVWREAGRIDILVNNAAVGFLERFNEVTPESWRRTLRINLDAPFFLTQRIAEHMIGAGIRGRVINISSTNALVAEAGIVPYNASKGGLELLTQSLAIELGQHAITVNSICPGMIENVVGADIPMDFEGFLPYFRQHVPLEQRLGTIQECADAVVFLASPAGSYVTAQHLALDGGLLAQQVPRTRFMPPYQSTLG